MIPVREREGLSADVPRCAGAPLASSTLQVLELVMTCSWENFGPDRSLKTYVAGCILVEMCC